MLTRADWMSQIAHAGSMALIARVPRWDANGLEAVADAPGSSHPLLRSGRLHAVHACEYGAQAAAIHGALLARSAQSRCEAGGLLAALREVRLGSPWIALTQPLEIHACRYAALPTAMQYTFEVWQGETPIASGRILIALPTAAP